MLLFDFPDFFVGLVRFAKSQHKNAVHNKCNKKAVNMKYGNVYLHDVTLFLDFYYYAGW